MRSAIQNWAPRFVRFAFGATLVVLSVTGVRAESPKSKDVPCSLALVTRAAAPNANICDEETVRSRARGGRVFEQNQMGIASVLAIAPDMNVNQAADWFLQAARQGYAPAQVNLAAMHANGWGVPQNYGAALHWLHAAADQQFAPAYYNLGVLYLRGKGVRQDYAEALKWFRKGADAGDAMAETNLGYLYDRGLGVARDAKTAASWYSAAASKGSPLAEYNLADMYQRGLGVERDDRRAFDLFQKSARKGHTGARIQLAYMLSQGRGTTRDLEAAYAWVTAAVDAGDDRGRELMIKLKGQLKAEEQKRAESRSRELLAAKLSPAEESFQQ